jgi:hypothetical protein
MEQKKQTARGEIQRQQRRRRNTDALQGTRRRLAVDESKLDRENFEYRFVNDTEMRIHQLTVLDDWDIVQDRSGETKKDGASTGSEVAVQAGGASGPQRQILLRKSKEYFKDDHAAQQRRIDEQEAALMRGAVPGGDASNTYVPEGEKAPMKISRG